MDRIRAIIQQYYSIIFLILISVIVILSFYAGMLEGSKRGNNSPVALYCSDDVLTKLTIPVENLLDKKDGSSNTQNLDIRPVNGKYAASKNGTKYYTPGCSGLKRIKKENIIWFNSVEDAILQGYSAAKC